MQWEKIGISILIIWAILTGLVIITYVTDAKKTATPSPVIPTPAAPDQVVCTMDAKACPDGSYVGRVPPTCEFAPCPSEKLLSPK